MKVPWCFASSMGRRFRSIPTEVEVMLGGCTEGAPRWLEFDVFGGPLVKVEAVDLAGR